MYLGLDLGTSGLRGILVDEGGAVRAEAEAALVVSHPHPGWSEQDPAAWIGALEAVVAQLRAGAGSAFADLRGIGMSGHMHGATLVGQDGAPLRPCILWNDTRSHLEAAALDTDPAMRAVTGNIVFPGFTAPKLIWVAKHEPEVFAKVAKVLLPKDFLRLYLTGEMASEMSDAAGTAWLDVGARDWSDAALAAGGMRRDQMPSLVEGSAESGRLRGDLLASWGLSQPVVVAGGAADNAAAACGAGCLGEGSGFVSLGTSGVLMAGRDSFSPAPETAVHSFCHAVPGRWYQMGVILAATDSLNWLAKNLGQGAGALASALPDAAGAPGSAIYLPYLSGERTPHNDSAMRGAFVGLDVSMGPEALTRAVMEGVAFALRDNLEALRGAGARPGTLLAVGGGARSRYWLGAVANALDLPLALPKGSELGAAMGAARLAICAATGAAPEDVMTPPETSEIIAPDPAHRAAWEDGYARYRALYPALKAVL
ncbi:xylulokinase [Rhodovulum sp. DZ06]|uniref:xylulokinase n=1 Tax=Rhodovulum sp. DZ06 TaxID=3425126 RepID=UPI003D33B7EF